MREFVVAGTPVPQGSLRSFQHPGTGRVVTPQTPKVVIWRSVVATAAREVFDEPTTAPIKLRLEFRLVRPKSHYGSGRNADRLRPLAPAEHTQMPDVDKLARAVGDALSGIVYEDDSQVCVLVASKRWCDKSSQAGVTVTVEAMPNG